MKKTILLAVGILMPLFIFSQIGFQEFYGRPNTEKKFTAIIPLDEGGFLLGGTDSDTDGNGDDFWIVKTDSLGQEIWSNRFGNHNRERLNTLKKTPDDGYLIGGTQYSSNNKSAAYLIKLNSDFNIVWEKKLQPSDTYNYLSQLHIEANGNIIVAVSNNSLSLFKIAPDGQIIWETETTDISEPMGITPTSDGHYFLHGKKHAPNNTRFWILKINTNGNTIWKKEIVSTENYDLNFQSVHKSVFGEGHILIGYRNGNWSFIIKLDDNADIAWEYYFKAINPPREIIETDYNNFLIYTQNNIHSLEISLNEAHYQEIHELENITTDDILGAYYSDIKNEHFVVGIRSNEDSGKGALILNIDHPTTENWHVLYGQMTPSHADYGWSVLQTPDNGFVMSGQSRFPSNRNDSYIIKTDSIGNIEWEMNHDEGNNHPIDDFGFSDIKLTSDQNLLFTGWSRLNSDTILFVLIKTDIEGNLIWKKRHPYLSVNDFVFCNTTNDSSTIITLYGNREPEYSSLHFFKIDPNGDSISLKNHPSDIGFKRIYQTIFTSDNHIVGIGEDRLFVDSAWIFKANTEGELIFDIEFDVSECETTTFNDIEKTSQNNYLIPITNEEKNKLSILTIAPDGTINENKLLSTEYYEIKDLHINKTNINEYLISFLANENYFYISRINENLEILETHEYDKLMSQKINDTQATSDNSLVLFGNATNINTQDWYLIKTWPNGAVETINILPFGKMNIHPNPSPAELNINFENEYVGELEIKIINSNGQILRHFKENKNSDFFEKKYDMGSLPSGAYFIRLAAEGKSISRTWIKQ